MAGTLLIADLGFVVHDFDLFRTALRDKFAGHCGFEIRRADIDFRGIVFGDQKDLVESHDIALGAFKFFYGKSIPDLGQVLLSTGCDYGKHSGAMLTEHAETVNQAQKITESDYFGLIKPFIFIHYWGRYSTLIGVPIFQLFFSAVPAGTSNTMSDSTADSCVTGYSLSTGGDISEAISTILF